MAEEMLIGKGHGVHAESSQTSEQETSSSEGESTSGTACRSTSEQLWVKMYHHLSRASISLSVLVDCLELNRFSSVLMKHDIITQSQLTEVLDKAKRSADNSDVNRHLLDVVVRIRSKHRKQFIQLVQENQLHIWHLSQRRWCGPKPMSTPSCSEWQFLQTSIPKVWLHQLSMQEVLLVLKDCDELSHVQYLELITLMKMLPKPDVVERLVCIVQWKPASSHIRFRSVLQALIKEGKKPVDEPSSTAEETSFHCQTDSAPTKSCPVPLLYGMIAQQLAREHRLDRRGGVPFSSSYRDYVSATLSCSPWAVTYDLLRSSGLSLIVVVDCVDTSPVAELLHRHGVLREVEIECIRRVKDPLDGYVRRWLVNAVTTKSWRSQEFFVSTLLIHQPYLVDLSERFWSGPELFSSSCGEYWALQHGFVHKVSLCDLSIPSFLQALQRNALLTYLEHRELMALRERLHPSDVGRRLACMVACKSAKEQTAFVSILDEAVRCLAPKITMGRSDRVMSQSVAGRHIVGKRGPAKGKSLLKTKETGSRDGDKTNTQESKKSKQSTLFKQHPPVEGCHLESEQHMPEASVDASVSEMAVGEDENRLSIFPEVMPDLKGDSRCDVKSWMVVFDALHQTGFSLSVVIDNMLTRLVADLLMDHSILQPKYYAFICFSPDIRQAELNRFLLDQISQQSIQVWQKFLEWLRRYQPNLASTHAEEDGVAGHGAGSGKAFHSDTLPQSLSSTKVKAILHTVLKSGTFSNLEECELLTLAERLSGCQLRDRLVAMVKLLPEKQYQACMAVLQGICGGDEGHLTDGQCKQKPSEPPLAQTKLASSASADRGELTLSASATQKHVTLSLVSQQTTKKRDPVLSQGDPLTTTGSHGATLSLTSGKINAVRPPDASHYKASPAGAKFHVSSADPRHGTVSSPDPRLGELFAVNTRPTAKSLPEPQCKPKGLSDSQHQKMSSVAAPHDKTPSTASQPEKMSSTPGDDSGLSSTVPQQKTLSLATTQLPRMASTVPQREEMPSSNAGDNKMAASTVPNSKKLSLRPTQLDEATSSVNQHKKMSLTTEQDNQSPQTLSSAAQHGSMPSAVLQHETMPASPTKPCKVLVTPTSPASEELPLKSTLQQQMSPMTSQHGILSPTDKHCDITTPTTVQHGAMPTSESQRESTPSVHTQHDVVSMSSTGLLHGTMPSTDLQPNMAAATDSWAKAMLPHAVERCSFVEQDLRKHDISLEKVVECMRSVEVLQELQKQGMLNSSECRDLASRSQQRPRCLVNEELLQVVILRPEAIQRKFVEILLQKQPELCNKPEKEFSEDFLLDIPQPPYGLLIDIARAIPDDFTATKLAIALDIGEDLIHKVRANQFTDDTVFVKVFQPWLGQKGVNATGEVLLNALVRIKRLDLADRFKRRLLGQTGDARADECHSELLDYEQQMQLWCKELINAQSNDFSPMGKESVADLHFTLSSLTCSQAQEVMGKHQSLSLRGLCVFPEEAATRRWGSVVELDKLVRELENERVKRTLIIGPSGSGKSAACTRMISEWVSKRSFRKFSVAVHLSGRDRSRLEGVRMTTLLSLDKHGFSQSQQERLLVHLKKNSHKLLFLIDDADKFGEDGLLAPKSILREVLEHRVFPNATLVIATQPSAHLSRLLSICDKYYYLPGFSEEGLQAFFNQRLSADMASGLMGSLLEPQAIHIKSLIKSSPLFASMAAELCAKHSHLPNTISGLFEDMLLEVCRRYECRTNTTILTAHHLSSHLPAVTELQRLALEGVLAKWQTFGTTTVNEACCRAACDLGLIRKVVQITASMRDCLFSFCHQLWQEFLAAQQLVHGSDFLVQLRACVTSKAVGLNEHAWQFWRFLSALVPPRQLPEVIYQLVDAQMEVSGDRGSQRFKCFLTSCVAESAMCQQHSRNTFIQMAMAMIWGEGRIDLADYDLSVVEANAVGVVLKQCPSIHVLSFRCSKLQDKHIRLLSPGLAQVERLHFFQIGAVSEAAMQCLTSSATCCQEVSIEDSAVDEAAYSVLAKVLQVSSIKRLSLSNCGLTSAILHKMMAVVGSSQWQSLEKFAVMSSNLEQSSGVLQLLVQALPRAVGLVLKNCRLQNSDVSALLTAVASNDDLIELNISQNAITEGVSPALTELMQTRHQRGVQNQLLVRVGGNKRLSLSSVHQLPFRACNSSMLIQHNNFIVGKNGAKKTELAEELKILASDGHIIFNYADGDSAASEVAKVLETRSDILVSSLTMSSSRIRDAGASALANTLPESTTLEGLSLSHNSVSLAGWQTLYAATSQNRSLKAINLSDNPLFTVDATPRQSRILQDRLQPSLQVLCLSDTGMDDQSLESWCKPLLGELRLKILDLSDNMISDHGVRRLLRYFSLQQFSLSILSLSDNYITDEGAERLSEKLQKVLHDNPGYVLKRILLGANRISPDFFECCKCEVLLSSSWTIAHRELKNILKMCGGSQSEKLLAVAGREGIMQRAERSAFLPVALAIEMMVLLGTGAGKHRDDAACDRWLQRCMRDNARRQQTAEFYLHLTDLLIFSTTKMGMKDQLEFCRQIVALIDTLLAKDLFVEQLQAKRLRVEERLDNVSKFFTSAPVSMQIKDYRRQFLASSLSEVAAELSEQVKKVLGLLAGNDN